MILSYGRKTELHAEPPRPQSRSEKFRSKIDRCRYDDEHAPSQSRSFINTQTSRHQLNQYYFNPVLTKFPTKFSACDLNVDSSGLTVKLLPSTTLEFVTITIVANATQVTGDDLTADPRRWLANALRVRFDDIDAQRGNALEPGNVDGVHDMRVAIRRFRSLIGDLRETLDTRPLRSVNRTLKSQAELLGHIRDRDVYIEELLEMIEQDADARFRRAVHQLNDISQQVRSDAFRDLTDALTASSAEHLAESFSSAIDDIESGIEPANATSLAETGRSVIQTRLDELADCGDHIYDPLDEKGLHTIRIAAKRLRYSAELFTPFLGETARPIAEQAAKMQSLLGDLHDCDIWIADIAKLLKKQANDASVDPIDRPSLARIVSGLAKKRTNRYRSALELWTAWQTTGALEILRGRGDIGEV